MDHMEREWIAWRLLCKALEAKSIDVNEEKLLIARIQEWGEWLSQLRATQDPAVHGSALDGAQNAVKLAGGVPVTPGMHP